MNKIIYENFEHFELRRLNEKASILLTYSYSDSRLADQHGYKLVGTGIDRNGDEFEAWLMPPLAQRSKSTYCRTSYFG